MQNLRKLWSPDSTTPKMEFNLYHESADLTNSMHGNSHRKAPEPACVDLSSEAHNILELKRIFEAEASSQSDIVDLVAEYLDTRVQDSDDQGWHQSHPFQGASVRFTPSFFIRRISKYSRASPCCILLGLVYLERLEQRCPHIRLSSTTFQRLLLVCCMTAVKFVEDISFSHNKSW